VFRAPDSLWTLLLQLNSTQLPVELNWVESGRALWTGLNRIARRCPTIKRRAAESCEVFVSVFCAMTSRFMRYLDPEYTTCTVHWSSVLCFMTSTCEWFLALLHIEKDSDAAQQHCLLICGNVVTRFPPISESLLTDRFHRFVREFVPVANSCDIGIRESKGRGVLDLEWGYKTAKVVDSGCDMQRI